MPVKPSSAVTSSRLCMTDIVSLGTAHFSTLRASEISGEPLASVEKQTRQPMAVGRDFSRLAPLSRHLRVLGVIRRVP